MINSLRKIYLSLLLLLLGISIFGQTPYWNEDFLEPQEWTLEGNWIMNTGHMRFDWYPIVVNFDMSAVSPVISLEDREYGLSINQFLEPWQYSATTEKAEISIISDTNEFILWSYDLSNGIWGTPAGMEMSFDITPYANTDIQIRFRSYGPTTDAWYWWDVFDISIITFMDNDMAVSGISGPVNLELNESGNWEVEVKNVGIDYRKDFTIKLFDYKTGNLIDSIQENDSLGFGETRTYTFEWYTDSAYNTALYAVLENEGDEFEANNISSGSFLRVKPERDINILVWENDNGIPTIVDPEIGDEVRPSDGLKRALRSAGFEYDSVYSLPDTLQDQDVIFAVLGCYCVS